MITNKCGKLLREVEKLTTEKVPAYQTNHGHKTAKSPNNSLSKYSEPH